jgi:hypothetical protein
VRTVIRSPYFTVVQHALESRASGQDGGMAFSDFLVLWYGCVSKICYPELEKWMMKFVAPASDAKPAALFGQAAEVF